MRKHKSEIITFKVDEPLAEALGAVSNRSEFIRAAITAALGATCPLCQGTGIMTPSQKEHWDGFTLDHSVKKCGDCHEWHLTCSRSKTEPSSS